MKPTVSSNPLVKCPFCGKSMKGRNLVEHVKRLHVNDPKFAQPKRIIQTPLIDSIEVKSSDLIRDIKQYVIDENGFLVLSDMLGEKNIEANSETLFPLPESPHPLEEPHIFDEIKSTGRKVPSARLEIEKIRPRPNEVVDCPICNDLFLYKVLFDHISFYHKEKNAKIVLAEFNREYERSATSSSSKLPINKTQK